MKHIALIIAGVFITGVLSVSTAALAQRRAARPRHRRWPGRVAGRRRQGAARRSRQPERPGDGHQVEARLHLRHAEEGHQSPGLLRPVGLPAEQPFSVECTSIANLDRAAQNLKSEAVRRPEEAEAMLDALEKTAPVSSPNTDRSGTTWGEPDQSSARGPHDDRRAWCHDAVDGTARQPEAGWRVDHECGHVDGPHHDPVRPNQSGR